MLLFFLTAALLSPKPEAPRVEASCGVRDYGKETIDQIAGFGVVKLNGTSVTDRIYVEGCLIAKDATLTNLEVVGETNLSDTEITKAVDINGPLRCQKCTFHEKITLSAQKAVFTDSTVKAITFRNSYDHKGKQILELRQRTTITGPIIFESGKGEVHIYPGCKLQCGVQGGKIFRKG